MKPPRLTVIHLARKPLNGTVAATALKYGTGGLNIGACRIGVGLPIPGGGNGEANHGGRFGGSGGTSGTRPRVDPSNSGRWPANLVLQHSPQCVHLGERTVRSNGHHPATRGVGGLSTSGHRGQEGLEERAAGAETVEAWECVEGCPCLDLDQQSGVRTSGARDNRSNPPYEGPTGWKGTNRGGVFDASEGGASRFFQQVQSREELVEYLRTLISPPPAAQRGEAVTMSGWPEWVETAEKGSLVGIIVSDLKPTQDQTKTLLGLLAPGAHLCLFAPDDQPTGHRGAILLEDEGFEIRDAILWVRGPERVHYVAKPSRAEREAGCQHLPAKRGFEAVERKEGSAGTKNPRAGAGRTADEVHNSHPTVKALALMEKLLHDIPTDQGPVLEPFLGSGTTAIACRKTGHDVIAIERELEYLVLADARVRYWDSTFQGWLGATIISDAPDQAPPSLTDLSDWFD